MKVIAHQGDTLDDICWRAFGNTDCLEKVCELNPHTLDSPILTEGVTVTLPDDVEQPKKKEVVKLWD